MEIFVQRRFPSRVSLLSFALGALQISCATTHHDHPHSPADSVATMGKSTPAKPELVQVRELQGPDKTSGIASVKSLGSVDLTNEFSAMAGYQFRARIFTISPGGVVARHQHRSRPGYAYIISGKIMEHRNDRMEPIERKAGDIAIERTGIAHWWENTFDEPVVALVVDILKEEY